MNFRMDISSGEAVIQWDVEAQAVINDVKAHVQDIQITNIPATSMGVYFNITTIENKKFCVHLGAPGFKVVGNVYNDTSGGDMNRTFETPYALLCSLSQQYAKSFGDLVMKKLCELDENSQNN